MKKFLLLFLSIVSLNSCSALGDSYLENKIEDLEDRVEKLEADNTTLKFHLGISESQIEALKEKEEAEKQELENNEDFEDIKDEEEDVDTNSEDEKIDNEDDNANSQIHSIGINKPENNVTLSTDPIEFTGEVSEGATKITVIATGIDFKDEYVLKNFEAGDDSFWYKASKQFANLDKGENTYEFIVEFSDGETITHTHTIYFE